MAVGADLPPDPASLSDEERAAIRKRMYNQRAIPVPA
jgi:GST-like protein